MRAFTVKHSLGSKGSGDVVLSADDGWNLPDEGDALYLPTPYDSQQTIFGVPLEEVFSILVDGFGWLEVVKVTVDLVPGGVKMVTVRIRKNAAAAGSKKMGITDRLTLPVSRIVAVGLYEE